MAKRNLKQTFDEVQELLDAVNTKQEQLVSGSNIKTINNQNLLGSGNITIDFDGAQELWDAVNIKQEQLVSGYNIKTINNQNLLGSGNITIEGGEGGGGGEGGSEKYPNNFEGKIISIMGDSISTYAGYTPVADGHNLNHRNRYPQSNLISSTEGVSKTWWMRLITNLGAKLGINDSWAGSRVSNAQSTNSGDLGPDACMSSITRITNLGANGTPDIILFFGGTNDAAASTSAGSFDSTGNYKTVNLTNTTWTTFAAAYKDAIMRMQYYYPKAKIVSILPMYTISYYSSGTVNAYNEVITKVCAYFGVPVIDLRTAGINFSNYNTMLPDGIHPNADGMALMEIAIRRKLLELFEFEEGERTTYPITTTLTGGLVSSKGYYKSVSANASYTTTFTGNVTSISVTMNGIDITSTAYNSSTKVLSIGQVNGPVVIKATGNTNVYATAINFAENTYTVSFNSTIDVAINYTPSNTTVTGVTLTASSPSDVSINGLSVTSVGSIAKTIQLTATYTGDNTVTASCDLVIRNPSQAVLIQSITINDEPTTYIAGQTYLLSADYTPYDATNNSLNWTSSNEKVATVDGGNVVCLTAGSTRITCSAIDDSGVSAYVDIVVQPAPTETWYCDETASSTPASQSVNLGGRGWCIKNQDLLRGHPINAVKFFTNASTNEVTLAICKRDATEPLRTTYTTVEKTTTGTALVTAIFPDALTASEDEYVAIFCQTSTNFQFYYTGGGATGSQGGGFIGRVPKVYGSGNAWTEYADSYSLNMAWGYISNNEV